MAPATQEDLPIEQIDLARLVARAALEKKAKDLVVLDVRGRTSYCDLFIICNGDNHRQVRAIAEGVLAAWKTSTGSRPVGVEGLSSGKWVLVDLGDVVLHVFEEPLRGYYDLDGLWMDAPKVALELDDVEAPTDTPVAP